VERFGRQVTGAGEPRDASGWLSEQSELPQFSVCYNEFSFVKLDGKLSIRSVVQIVRYSEHN
jgi:hypothetical protein